MLRAAGVLLLADALLIGYSRLAPQWNAAAVKPQFMSLQQMFDFSGPAHNDKADSITEQYLAKNDTLIITPISKAQIDSAFLPGDTLKQAEIGHVVLENPENKQAFALDAFFEALINERDTQVIHIAHYGDSQIEGDRVSSVIRRNLQAKFGGSGLGYVPLEDVATSWQFNRTTSGNWFRYTVFQNKISSSFYGLSGTVYRFKRNTYVAVPDSISPEGDTIKRPKKLVAHKNASISLKMNRPLQYDRLAIMYGNSTNSCKLVCKSGDKTLFDDSVKAASAFTMLNIPLDGKAPSELSFEMDGDKSPDFYGFMIDSKTGVQVDNYAIRGHAGGGLMSINFDYLSAQAKALHTRLFVFQYGANLIPYLESEEECRYYEEVYYKLFTRFKKAVPEASILVIGNGDMGTRIAGENKSYPYVAQLDSVMRQAALKAQCGYWSMLDAMGGENSILTWEKKGLASLDGHLTPKGQQIIGNLLFRSIMEEYNRYLLRNKPEIAKN